MRGEGGDPSERARPCGRRKPTPQRGAAWLRRHFALAARKGGHRTLRDGVRPQCAGQYKRRARHRLVETSFSALLQVSAHDPHDADAEARARP